MSAVDAEVQSGIPAPHLCRAEEAIDTLQEHCKKPPEHIDKGGQKEKAEQRLTKILKLQIFFFEYFSSHAHTLYIVLCVVFFRGKG